jgi:hypothetical protein
MAGRHIMSMAQLGMWQGVADAGKITKEGPGGKQQGVVLEGLAAFLLWRSAYWTKVRLGLVWWRS